MESVNCWGLQIALLPALTCNLSSSLCKKCTQLPPSWCRSPYAFFMECTSITDIKRAVCQLSKTSLPVPLCLSSLFWCDRNSQHTYIMAHMDFLSDRLATLSPLVSHPLTLAGPLRPRSDTFCTESPCGFSPDWVPCHQSWSSLGRHTHPMASTLRPRCSVLLEHRTPVPTAS